MSHNNEKGSEELWPKVTVIIVNWNGERFIERCLKGLLVQSVMPYEIIVVDNASSDFSLKIIQGFPTVKLLAQNENLGFSRGNNLAIKASAPESEWIALLNPDAFPETHWLEALLVAVGNYPAYEVFASKLKDAGSPSILDGVGDVYHISGRVWRLGRGCQVSAFPDEECEVFSPCAAAALYLRSAVLDVGGFDEDYFCYLEDIDLGFRLRLAGCRCFYVPKSVVHHVGSGTTGGQHSDFSTYHGHRNLVWTFVKDMPGILFWLLLPLHVLMNFASIIWFVFRGRGVLILRAKWDALLGLPKVWKKRKDVQSKRVATVYEIWRVLNKQLLPSKKRR